MLLTSVLPGIVRADYATEVLSENPLAYYRFDDGVVTDDLSTPEVNLGSLGAAADGQLSATFVRQVAGALTGSSDVAGHTAGNGFTVPYTAGLNFQGSFSAEVWLKPDAIPAAGALASPISSWRENTDTFGREGWLIYQGDAGTGFNFRTYNKNGAATAVSINSGAGVTAGAWHHVVVTWDHAAAIGKIYVNGVLKATSPVITPGGTNSRTFDANSVSGFTLGSRSDNAFGWTGDVDEAAYYADTVLSDTQVLAHYNNGINPTPSPSYDSLILADSPAGYWRLNNNWVPRTPPVADNAGSLGDGADGSYYAGSKNAATGPAPGSGFNGFSAGNSSLALATASGYVGTGLGLLNSRNEYTVMGWVKRGATVSTRGGYFGQNDVLEFGDAGGGTQIEAWNSTVGGVSTDAPYPFAENEWGFIAYTANASGAKLYLNGQEVKSANGTVSVYGSSAFNFNIGGGGIFNATGDYFRGEIDEVAMLDRAVSAGRIQQLYDAALGNVPPGLVDTFPAVSVEGEIAEGQSYTLSIDPTGTPPFTYQWKINGVDIPGATSQELVVTAEANDPPFDPFIYTVEVSNGFGSPVLSDEVEVYVTPTLRWTGSDGTNPAFWDLGTTQNWETFTGATASTYSDDYAVYFDDSATSTDVDLQSDLNPVSVVIDNTTEDYSFTGDYLLEVFGGNLVKTGSGTAEFANYAIDAFEIEVNEGTFRVGDGITGELLPLTKVTVGGGNFEINQAGGSTFECTTTVGSGQISFVGSGDLSSTANISGAGNEWFDRDGTVVIAGPNQIGGTVTINSGTVAFDGSQEGNRLPVNKAVTVNPGATMEIRGVNALPTGANSVDPTLTGATLSVVTGGSVATGAGGTSHAHIRHLTLSSSVVDFSYSGSGGVYNGESFQLNGNVTVTGSGASSIVAGTGATLGNSGLALSNGVVHTFAIDNVAAGPDLIVSAEIESGDAGGATAFLTKTGTGTLQLTGGINHSYAGTTQINGGTLLADGSIAGALEIGVDGTIAPGASAGTFGAGSTTLSGTYACEIDGAVSDRIEVNGDITLAATAQIDFSVLSGGATEPYYEIMSCTGTLSGPLPAASGTPPGYSLLVVSSSSLVLAQEGISAQPTVAAAVSSGSEDFNTNGGGFSVSAPVTPETDWTYTTGSWRSNGQASGFGADNTSYLISPVYTLTQAGPVTLTFGHRHSFEIDYDGGAVDVSFNGGEFTRVASGAFSQNGYNGSLGAVGHSLQNGEAFVGNSAGHPAFITSICTVATGAVGDTVQVRFISASDNNTSGNLSPQGWEIDSFEISGGKPSLITLEWPFGTMQYSDTLLPPWTDLSGKSPLVIDTAASPRRFFRLKP